MKRQKERRGRGNNEMEIYSDYSAEGKGVEGEEDGERRRKTDEGQDII